MLRPSPADGFGPCLGAEGANEEWVELGTGWRNWALNFKLQVLIVEVSIVDRCSSGQKGPVTPQWRAVQRFGVRVHWIAGLLPVLVWRGADHVLSI